MFYCDECAERKKWPYSMTHSYGRCEMCRETRLCNDVPTSHLPHPEREKTPVLEAICSCGYRGVHWHKHRETSLRWGHDPADHQLVDVQEKE